MIRFLAPALCSLALHPAHASEPVDARALAIRADRVLLGDGHVLSPGVILTQEGHIAAVGADVSIPEDALVVVHKGIASAGLIALHSHSGSPVEMRDATRTL